MIGGTLFGTVDRFLVGGMLGASALAAYSVCIQLAQQVHAVPAAAGQILLPRISRIDDRRHIISITGRAFLVVALMTGAIALPLCIFSHDILRLWVGSAIADRGAGILRVTVIAYICMALSSVAYYVLLAMGRARSVAQISLAGGLISLATTWLLIKHLDLTGAALSRVVYGLLMCLLIVDLARHLRKDSTQQIS